MEQDISPAVTIITRTFERPLLIERAICSVLALDYENWQHIIINNGGSIEILSNITSNYLMDYDGRLTIINLPEKVSLGAALNIGIRKSETDYLIFLDDDDTFEKSILSSSVPLLANSHDNLKVIHFSTNIIDEYIFSGKVFTIGPRRNYFQCKTISLFDLFVDEKYTPIAYLFKRNLIENIGFFDEVSGGNPSWSFWIRILSKFRVLFLDVNLANWHHRDDKSGAYANNSHSNMISYNDRISYLNDLVLDSDKSSIVLMATLATYFSANQLELDNKQNAKISKITPYRILFRSVVSKILKFNFK